MEYTDFPQGSFDPKKFDQLLNGPLTYRAVYQRAHLCPCTDSRRAGPDPKCATCKGRGYYFDAPLAPVLAFQEVVVGSETRPPRLEASGATITSATSEYGVPITGITINSSGLLNFSAAIPQLEVGTLVNISYTAPAQSRLHAQGIRTNREYLDRGEVQLTDLDISIPRHLPDLTSDNPAWMASENDLFTLSDVKKRAQQRMIFGSQDRLTYQTIHRVLEVRSRNPITGAIVIHAPAEYAVNPSGLIVWGSGFGPAPASDGETKQSYVVEYECAPTYYVHRELPQMRHVSGEELPRRVGLRLYELFPGRKP